MNTALPHQVTPSGIVWQHTYCSTCSKVLDAERHQIVTTRHGDRLPYCAKGCRKPTDLDRATSTVRWVSAPKTAAVL